MSSNQYTQKSMEAIQNAQALAGEYGNQELSQAHLLAALTESGDGLIAQLLTQMGTERLLPARGSAFGDRKAAPGLRRRPRGRARYT